MLLKLWRNKETRSVIIQIVTIALLFAFFAYIINNAVLNLQALGKTFSFDFLKEPASYDINQALIEYTSRSSHARAMLVGILNTALVAVCGIVTATVVGFLLGVIRLSSNWLAARLVYVFIEFTRNVPVLLHILLIHGIIVHFLPLPKQAINVADALFLSNRGVYAPRPEFLDGFVYTTVAFVVAVIGAVLFRRWAKKVQEATGKIYPVFSICLGVVVVLPLVVFLLSGSPLTWEMPKMGRFNLQGGVVMLPEFLALWLALSLYTSAFISEIVRSGIMAISKGQWEAAGALGIRRNRTLQLVIIPQALRVIIPPLASQYLNLTKNSSLAIAIGYMDIVATIGGITLMQTGKEMETMIIVLLIYLSFSLVISAFMNWYNKRIALVER
ncbi:MAG: amino acid ABC transporter permease [Rhodospirillales bacterium CG15_BIG_FIL_POST_REV_8_21_14_020_66_15]|nr:MAG: amino acid ABC transporter permease [Rhodospirillales bacterium CG15_BIG_FIL_POST_REV_8_21_14_020_66_15]